MLERFKCFNVNFRLLKTIYVHLLVCVRVCVGVCMCVGVCVCAFVGVLLYISCLKANIYMT